MIGGELAADGNIYGVPGTAKSVVKIDPRTDVVSEVGDLVVVPGAIRGNRFKWLRGAVPALAIRQLLVMCRPSLTDCL